MAKNDEFRIQDDVRPFYMIQNDIVDNSVLLTANEKYLYMILMRFGKNAFPSLATLSECTGLSKRTIQTTLNGLCTKGIVKKEVRHREDGGQTSNLYTLINTREVWAAQTPADIAAAVTDAEAEFMIAALIAKGYKVEKEAVSASQSKDTAPQALSKDSKKPCGHDNMNNPKKQSKSRKQVAQVSTTEQFKQDSQTSVPTMNRYLQELKAE